MRIQARFGFAFSIVLLTLLAGCSVPESGEQTPAEGQPDLVTREVAAASRVPTKPAETAMPVYFTPTPESAWQISTQPSTQRPPAQEFAKPPMATSTPGPLFELCSPLADHNLADLQEILTNPFKPPPSGQDTGHHGVDFAYYRRGERLSILGVTVEAVLPGRVAAVVVNRIPYGNMAIVETPFTGLSPELVDLLHLPAGSSLYLLYAHMNEAPVVGLNEPILCGQALGEVGNTPKGWSSDPHLHLEVRAGPPDITFPGMVFYDTGATVEEMENYRLWRMSGEFQMLDPMAILEYGLARQAPHKPQGEEAP